MSVDDPQYLKDHLREALRVVDSSLACIYRGETHMYRALAGQLRLLLCDIHRGKDNSLLSAAFPNLRISALCAMDWSPESAGLLELRQGENGDMRIATMPFDISLFSNGLAVADLLMSKDDGAVMSIAAWMSQPITVHPTHLTARAIVRAVADKGGGSHVDRKASAELRYMEQLTPAGRTFAEMFVVGLGRLVQAIGEKLFGYTGCRVPNELVMAEHQKFSMAVVSASNASAPSAAAGSQ